MSAVSDNPQAGAGRPLPKKESDLFKSVVKHYEAKQYKKGMKCADTILKRFGNHGETLCMKGLIVNCTGKKEDAHALVKKGLMFDMRSHVCWHVYGLLYRSDRDYNEAIKAYKQALRIDEENLQILRDMSLLQIQMRDLPGFVATRLRILTLRPNNKVHWLSYALAMHVNGDPGGAARTIDSYLDSLGENSEERRKGFESSELAMYRNRVLAESDGDGDEDESGTENGDDGLGGVRAALADLEDIVDIVVDRTGWLLAKLTYRLKLGLHGDAAETCLALFKRGCTDDHKVHAAYMCAVLKCDGDTCEKAMKLRGTATLATMRQLDEREREVLLQAYGYGKEGNGADEFPGGGLSKAYPRSNAVKRIRLALLDPSGEDFRSAVDEYCRKKIVKGVPSLGADLSSLYLMEDKDRPTSYVLASDPVDVKSHPVHLFLVELVDGYISSLSSTREAFPGDDTPREPPSTILWAWYLRTILHEQRGEYAAALTLVEKCITHTPTGVDFYELKSRLLAAGGDVAAAADVVDYGRDLDHQDRYINNLATKALLAAGREGDARTRVALFTRHEGNPEQNLYDMQCTWYELDLADSYVRRGEYGKSLRKYMAVVKHFEDFHEDQFDFHAYCIRKVTLRSYADVLKFEDDIWGQPFYGRAAEGIINIYLHLLDNPEESDDATPDYSNMTAAERKRAKNIARKKKKAAEKKDAGDGAGAENGGGAHDNGGEKGGKKKTPHAVDEDPDGKDLLKLDYAVEANKYVSILVTHAPRRLSSWVLRYDVAIRRGKMLMALQALFKMQSIDPNSHELFSRVVDFSKKLSQRTEKGNPASEEVLETEFAKLMKGKSLSEYVQVALNEVKGDSTTSLPMLLAVSKAMVSTGFGSGADAASLIVDSGLKGRCVNVETCREVLTYLKTLDATELKERFVALVFTELPFIKHFC